jgi:hypothetical protein
MITRRSLTFLVLALALFAPATAQAETKPKPKSSGPKIFITLTDGGSNTKTVNPTVAVTFTPPKGTTVKTACKGKVTVSVPVGKKTVKVKGKTKKKTIYAKKTASIKSPLGVCTASPVVKVPIALLGKTLKFTATFKGNDAVKKFSKSSKFLLKYPDPPAPTFVPAPGAWIVQQNLPAFNPQQWKFTIGADGVVAKIDRITNLSAICDGSKTVFLRTDENDAPFDTPFTIASPSIAASDDWVDPTYMGAEAKTASTFTLQFDSPSHATGTFRLTGKVAYLIALGADTRIIYNNCDTGLINIELKPGVFA